jgi:Vitamin B6 photo-protection and homoeostasis
VSRLATILFAYRFGTALEAETKRYRLAADVFNDSAMILDCLSPAFPRSVRILMLCMSGALRAACGVAGGGSKASLSVHFARTGNVGELNAKVR